MKLNILISFVIVILVSCESGDVITTLTMKDGRAITIVNGVKYYPSVNDFKSSVSFTFDSANDKGSVDTISYRNGERYKIKGYSSDTIVAWEIAKFGNWIEKYGLKADQNYYVCTRIFKQYVSRPPEGTMIVPALHNDSMGYCPGINYPTFTADYNKDSKFAILKTGERVIGYDSDRNSIFHYIPNLTKITWKFSVQDDGWE